MTYPDLLHPWCIIRCLPNAQSLILGRFRRRSQAEAHLQILRQLLPDFTYEIVFDSGTAQTDWAQQLTARPHSR